MTYPSREDFAARDRRAAEHLRRTSEQARERYGADFASTGLCQRYVRAMDQAHQPCPVCGHADVLHGGYLNRGDPDLTGCLICALKLLACRDPVFDPAHNPTRPQLDSNDE